MRLLVVLTAAVAVGVLAAAVEWRHSRLALVEAAARLDAVCVASLGNGAADAHERGLRLVRIWTDLDQVVEARLGHPEGAPCAPATWIRELADGAPWLEARVREVVSEPYRLSDEALAAVPMPRGALTEGSRWSGVRDMERGRRLAGLSGVGVDHLYWLNLTDRVLAEAGPEALGARVDLHANWVGRKAFIDVLFSAASLGEALDAGDGELGRDSAHRVDLFGSMTQDFPHVFRWEAAQLATAYRSQGLGVGGQAEGGPPRNAVWSWLITREGEDTLPVVSRAVVDLREATTATRMSALVQALEARIGRDAGGRLSGVFSLSATRAISALEHGISGE